MKRIVPFLGIVFALGAAISAQTPSVTDWPQWRGPDRTGISKETGLLNNGQLADQLASGVSPTSAPDTDPSRSGANEFLFR